MEAWKRVEPTKVTKVGWRTIVSKQFEVDGKVAVFDTTGAEGHHASAVIALTDNNQVVIASQFRPGPEKIMDEIPGGGVELDEDPQDAALRELKEETGYVPSEKSVITSLGSVSTDAYANFSHNYFLVTNVVLAHDQALEENEVVIVKTISIEQLFDNAKKGLMTDAVALLLAHDALRNIEEKSNEEAY